MTSGDLPIAAPMTTGVADSQPMRLRIRDLNFYYGKTQALHNVNLIVPDRQVMALIGPSGCGKSTLLRCINRMYDLYPDQRAEGIVELDGTNILARDVDINLLRSRVGMVFQRPTPFPLSIHENVAFGLKLNERLSRREMGERVEWALRRAALWDEVSSRLDKSALALSGGQQQRLCIARTIAIRPSVILFDEPTSALDPIATARIEELIDELKSDFTIVIVTHNLQQAARCSDRTAFLYQGEVVEVGPSVEIFTNPRQERTQDYVTGRFG